MILCGVFPHTCFRRICSGLILSVFLATTCVPPAIAQPMTIRPLPALGTMVEPSAAFVPILLRGMTVFPNNPLQFEFILDNGNTGADAAAVKDESGRLIRYFLAALTIPKDEMWVNLSPYEKDRIVPDSLGATALGRDMLAQDYLLKQLTASLLYPEDELGAEFWEKVYAQAKEKFGTTDIPFDTFNKVWIIPESASVYEHENTVYVVGAKLKVLLEEDYVAQQKVVGGRQEAVGEKSPITDSREPTASASSVQSSIIREIIIPAIEKEVNEGKNFALLRQVYHSLILAQWYRDVVTESLLSKVYIDKKKTAGIDLSDTQFRQQIYDQYLAAYKKGVYNYIKEEYDPATQELIPRKYFSGGIVGVLPDLVAIPDRDSVQESVVGDQFVEGVAIIPGDTAMLSRHVQLAQDALRLYLSSEDLIDRMQVREFLKKEGIPDHEISQLEVIADTIWALQKMQKPAGIAGDQMIERAVSLDSTPIPAILMIMNTFDLGIDLQKRTDIHMQLRASGRTEAQVSINELEFDAMRALDMIAIPRTPSGFIPSQKKLIDDTWALSATVPIARLKKSLQDRRPAVRAHARKYLSDVGLTESVIQLLDEVIAHTKGTVRKEAEEFLIRLIEQALSPQMAHDQQPEGPSRDSGTDGAMLTLRDVNDTRELGERYRFFLRALGSADPVERIMAARVLGDIGGSGVLNELLAAIGRESDMEARSAIHRAMNRIEDRGHYYNPAAKVADDVIEMTIRGNTDASSHDIAMLTTDERRKWLDGDAVVAGSLVDIGDPNPTIRWHAWSLLLKYKVPAELVIEAAIAAVKTADPTIGNDVRMHLRKVNSETLLGYLSTTEDSKDLIIVSSVLIDALYEQYREYQFRPLSIERTADIDEIEADYAMLGKRSAEKALQRLGVDAVTAAGIFESSSLPEVRIAALKKMIGSSDERVIAAMLNGLADPDDAVRIAVRKALKDSGVSVRKIFEQNITIVARDITTGMPVHREAHEAIQQSAVSADDAYTYMLAATRHESSWIRRAGAEVAGIRYEKRMIAQLLTMLHDTPDIIRAARQSLDILGFSVSDYIGPWQHDLTQRFAADDLDGAKRILVDAATRIGILREAYAIEDIVADLKSALWKYETMKQQKSLRNSYETLGVAVHATPEEITAAWRAKVKEHRGGLSIYATTEQREMIQRINDAYGILSGKTERLTQNGSDHDQAMMAHEPPGGIDLNDIGVTRRGDGNRIRFTPESMEPFMNMQIDGFVPVIFNVVPISDVLLLLGFSQPSSDTAVLSKS